MITLCQIIVVDDEAKFFEQLKKNGSAFGLHGGGWGRFTGEVPAINTSFEINFPHREGRDPAVFRVLYHHRVFNMLPLAKDDETLEKHLS